MKYLLVEDDCAPDARAAFERELVMHYGVNYQDFFESGEKRHTDDGDNLAFEYKGLLLSTFHEEPYWHLSKAIKSGAELISEERMEQIEKHGWDIENDSCYKHEELVQAALFALDCKRFFWPETWMRVFAEKIRKKDRIGQLKVAGALIAAEIDRLQNLKEE